MKRRTMLLALIAVLVTVAGCAQIESTATIGDDGAIEHYEMDMQFSDDAWELLQQLAASEGYDSVEQWLLDDDEEDEEESAIECAEGAEEVSVDEEGQSMHLECTDPVIRNESVVNVTVQDDGSILYRDAETAAWDENLEGTGDMGLNVEDMEFTFTVVFPEEVTNSNAHTVDGNEATWHMTEWEGGSLQATTGSASDMTGDDGEDTTDGTGDDSTDDSTESTGEEGGADDSGGGDETESGTDESDDGSADMESNESDSEGETDGDDGVGASGFTLPGVLIGLAALVGVGLRRRH